MTHQDPDHVEVNPEEANEIVSPENTEKLYGLKAIQEDPPASSESIETTLPEDIDAVDENMFPSAD